MSEFLAPGVFVEETSINRRTIEGVSTSTAGFVGPTRFGPVHGRPEPLSSFGDFERIYGGIDSLGNDDSPNYTALAVKAFFDNGGRRTYVARVATTGSPTAADNATTASAQVGPLTLAARHPGSAGNVTVTLTMRLSGNVLGTAGGATTLDGVSTHDVVWLNRTDAGPAGFATVHRTRDGASGRPAFAFQDAVGASVSGTAATDIRLATVDVEVGPIGQFMAPRVWTNLRLDAQHADSIQRVFPAATSAARSTELSVPLIVDGVADGVVLAELLDSETGSILARRLAGGTDGRRPGPDAYTGNTTDETGLAALEALSDISVVLAPAATSAGSARETEAQAATVQAVIDHCERMRHRVAIVDVPSGATPEQARDFRTRFDSRHAALYYPWIAIQNPTGSGSINVPASGHLAGIYARNDLERGVHKAPANLVIQAAVGLERAVTRQDLDMLNPVAVNCLREFPTRGRRVWGARLMSTDPEWKWIALRRYFAYLGSSIERGTAWAVFEPNGTALWDRVRQSVEDFLTLEFAQGHLQGNSLDEALFVRCDRTTMTQNDLDHGRLVCLIGVAPLRPAEFVTFRITQQTLQDPGGD